MPLPASRFAAALLALSTFALPAWADDTLIEPIGWSADEQRVAVRAYDFIDTDLLAEDEDPSCKGYVDHKGKSFIGSLRFEVYEKGKKVATFPIQDSGKCTPPKTAKARLTRAKAELLKLGIDLTLKQPGTVLTPEDKEGVAVITVKEGPGAPYTLEAKKEGTVEFTGEPGEPYDSEEEKEQAELYAERREKGELVVYLSQGGQRRKLAAKKYDYTYLPSIGDMLEVKLAQVWLSPKGRSAVFVSEYITGPARGRSEVLEVIGGASWDGVPLVLR